MPTKGDKGGKPQVLLGRPFLKTTGFKLIYYDEIFTFEQDKGKKIKDKPWKEEKGRTHKEKKHIIKPNHFKEKRKNGKPKDNTGSDQKKKKKKRRRSSVATNFAYPRIGIEVHAYAWIITPQPKSKHFHAKTCSRKPRRGLYLLNQVQSPRIGVEVHAYVWKQLKQFKSIQESTPRRGSPRLGVEVTDLAQAKSSPRIGVESYA
ncbi:hypothetical protein PIB30_090834 [Stylosanthes scabra]|uniref:Uncharacterized protein n=1 Tax=Stylosanthes scabra TaxID=79078 RepID=A0ABU6TXB6_9FABA|nr:hypothetical protein [Stylosanthes scabra]